ncbi:unnamed protein product [Owenia fusiformis]|uniref:BLOC-1-related complex subunit 6 C-terminal helix domain-containing protein n=1 Tax=Owenia fusiformis TaxID=6347 RepID=A0A8S4NWM0_OWEFU|nr:unnamed protein product [Owenia fusiformis]
MASKDEHSFVEHEKKSEPFPKERSSHDDTETIKSTHFQVDSDEVFSNESASDTLLQKSETTHTLTNCDSVSSRNNSVSATHDGATVGTSESDSNSATTPKVNVDISKHWHDSSDSAKLLDNEETGDINYVQYETNKDSVTEKIEEFNAKGLQGVDLSMPIGAHLGDYAITSDDQESLTSSSIRNSSSNSTDISNASSSSDGHFSSGSDYIPNGGLPRPDSLTLPRPLQSYERLREDRSEAESDDLNLPLWEEDSIEAAKRTPFPGTLVKDGEMVSYVAQDLQEMIRLSSPLSVKSTPDSSASHTPMSSHRVSRTSSLRSLSSNGSMSTSTYSTMSQSPSSLFAQSPEDMPPIDPRVVLDLELHARKVAGNLDLMMGNLKSNLHKMSAISATCLELYRDSVDHTCDSVDASIKSMYALMAKCEELSYTMTPIYKIADQIKEINRLLDIFETKIMKEEKTTGKKS